MKRSTVDIFLDLVTINALSCEEKPVADYIRKQLNRQEFSIVEDGSAGKTGSNTGNIIVRYKNGGNKVLLSHMDTARPTKELVPVVRDGKISGSGGTILGADNRAGCAILLSAALTVADEFPEAPGFTLAFTTCEETTLGGSKNLEINGSVSSGFVFDSSHEPGRYIYSACGAKRIYIEVLGKAAHSGIEPEKGINAVYLTAQALSKIPQGRIDEETTLNFGTISGGSAINVVPEKVILHAEIRSFDINRIEEETKKIKNIFETEVTNGGGKLVFRDEWDFVPYTIPESSAAAFEIENAIRSAQLVPEKVISLGGSDANSLNANGIPSVNIGIGAKNPHSDDEYIMTKDLLKAAEIAVALLRG